MPDKEDEPTKPMREERPRETKVRWRGLHDVKFTNANWLFFGEPRQDLFLSGPPRWTSLTADPQGEHEKTRQFISDKLAALPQREDLLRAKEETIDALSAEIGELKVQLNAATAELAKSKELEAHGQLLCEQIRAQHTETREQFCNELAELR